MAGPLYPDVPIAPGVPPVLRLLDQFEQPEPQLQSDSAEIDRLAASQWGIFTQGGRPIVNADNVASVEDGVEYRVADYPLEEGGYESYNKVATPREIRVAMSKGGTISDRQQFLSTLRTLEGDLEMYNVVTPEETFIDMNITGVRKSRTQANGASMLTVEVMLQEIRITATAEVSASKEPSGADDVNDGSVQTKDETSEDDQGILGEGEIG